MSKGRVLSIQSHVVHGYVGNRAAVFPLQILGFEVDFINSVQFSNHTQYAKIEGQRLKANELDELFRGLKANNLIDYTHLLTGYVGDLTFLNKLADIVDELKRQNKNLIYLCDPVMGDNGELYVPKELLPVYKERLLPKADIITPNLFELELLIDNKFKTEADLVKGMNDCHQIGVKTVIISSVNSFTHENKLCLYASSIDEEKIVKIEFDRLEGEYYGTGDTFAAMFLAWYNDLKSLKDACEHTVTAMLLILRTTLKASQLKKANNGTFDALPFSELQLIQSKSAIENPKPLIVNAILIDK